MPWLLDAVASEEFAVNVERVGDGTTGPSRRPERADWDGAGAAAANCLPNTPAACGGASRR